MDRYFKALIFDLNGTVVEIFKISEYMHNLKDIAGVLGLDLEKFKNAWKKSWNDYPFGDYESVEQRFDSALGYYFDGESHGISRKLIKKASKIRMKYITGQHRKIREGVLDAFKWALDCGYKLGMISNCSIETSIAWPKNPMARYIPDPSFSCDIKIKKPDAEIFLNELNKLHMSAPERCIYIADGDDGELETASALGMKTILVTVDKGNPDVFRHRPFPECEFQLEHFRDLPAIVEQLEGEKRAGARA
ncbi:MAG: HAD family hydrolase [Promethearchaeota archaeon]